MSNPLTIIATSEMPGDIIFLDRPRINTLLADAALRPLTLITAGAGYGKTHAVKTFLKAVKKNSIYHGISGFDNIKTRFWKSFTGSVAQTDKSLASKLSELGFPDTNEQFFRLAGILRGAIDADRPCFLAFDDLYLARERFIFQFLERIVELKIPNLSLILITRAGLPIDVIHFMSKGMISIIDGDKLKFTEAEMASYFSLHEIHLSPQSAQSIISSSEGWILALHLICESMKKPGVNDYHAINAMKSNIFQLIENELIPSISDQLLHFLIKISLLDKMPKELLEELGGDTHLHDDLANVSTFVSYDIYSNMYGMHNLFREYLLEKQDRLRETERKGLLLTAAEWYMTHDYKMEAALCFEKAGEYEKIMDIVCSMPQVIPSEDAAKLLEIVELAPKDIEDNELLYILRPRLLMLLGRYEDAAAEFRENIERFEGMSSTDFTAHVLAANYNGLGFIKILSGLHTREYDAVYYFETANNYYRLSGGRPLGPINISGVSSYAARVSVPDKGEIPRAIEEFAISIPHIANSMNGCMFGMDDLAWAEYHFFRNDLKKSERLAWQALYKAREKDQFEIENRALFYLVRIHLAVGNYTKIQELLELLKAHLDNPRFLNRYTLYDVVTGWFYASIHQYGRLADWLKIDFKRNDYLAMIHGFENLVKAKYYLSRRKYLPLLAFLSSQDDQNGLEAFIYGKIEIKVMEAVCHYHLRDTEAAMKALRDAYDLAEPNELFMPFVEMGQNMRTLCTAALKYDRSMPETWLENMRRKSSTYAKKAAYVASEYRLAHWSAADELPVLTKREMDLLRDLYHGLSRSEIAASHNMSINTVKAALQMIYEKLGANNAVDAVRIATALNLLE